MPADFRFGMKLEGFDEYVKRLNRMDDDTRNKILPKALRAMAKPVVGAARLKARFTQQPGSGALAESIGVKTKVNKQTGSGVAIIGARTGFETTRPDGTKENPVNIAHLVESGHAGPNGSDARTPPHPFLRPAFDERAGEGQAAGQAVLNKELDKFGM